MGPAGLTSQIQIFNETPGSNCTNGGIKVEVGIDHNSNGILDREEVQSTSYVCNGLDGNTSLTTVTNETRGLNCESGGIQLNSGVDSNRNGILEEEEINATAYVCNGLEGKESSTKVTNIGAGANCENGGLKINTGVDLNENGTLDDTEINSTHYVCNGLDGPSSLIKVIDESAGPDCENGGVKIFSGIDTDRNKILEDSEILITNYICNGVNGIINEEIQIKLLNGIGSAANTYLSNLLIVSSPLPFNINNFVNVDSVIFVSDPYVSKKSNHVLLELYNATDKKVLNNSLIRTNQVYNEKALLKSPNLFNELPKKEINLGIRLRSEINGEYAASGIPHLFLYRSKK